MNGTVNDLAVMGATPLYLSCALVLEEGLEFADLERILDSMKSEADRAGVAIVTGDTKVVPNGKADRIFINTSGIGLIEAGSPAPGDRARRPIIVSGTIGDHGMAIMALRNSLSFSRGSASDCAPLNHMIRAVTDSVPGQREIHARPDPGRRRVGPERDRQRKADSAPS